MPEISRFLGIVIAMFHREHDPAHFHAYYGEFKIIVEIETGKVIGKFPSRAEKLVLEWLQLNKNELKKNWELSKNKQALNKIQPLE